MPKHEFQIKKKIDLPGGGSITVTVSSPSPIKEEDYLILKPQAAQNMAECLVSMANAMRPPDSKEISIASSQ